MSADHFRRSSKRSVSISVYSADASAAYRTSSCAAMLLDIHGRKAAIDLCQNCVTRPKPQVNTIICRDTRMHIVVVGSR
jgi:hypothetical protein